MNEFLRQLKVESKLFTTPIITIGETALSLSSIIELIGAVLLVIFISRTIKNILKQRLLVKLGIDEGNREAIASIVSYGIGILGFVIVLQSTGFNLASLAVVVGGLGVGIGIGLQDITSNFISGIILLVDRTIKAGDYIEWQWLEEVTVKGTVKEISLRSTIVRTDDGADMVLPNSYLVGNQVLNWSYDSPKARIRIPVQVSVASDPVTITEILLNSAYMEPRVLYEPPPKVNFISFSDDTLEFQMMAWVTEIHKQEEILSSLHFIIDYNLRRQNIKGSFKKGLPEEKQPLSLRDLLRQVIYFQNLTDLELLQLISVGYRKRLRPSEILFKEEEPGDAFYIILSGSVEVYVEKINKHLTNLETGKFFGELSLMLGIPRTASVRSLEDTILFAINNKGFEKLLRDNPEFYEIIIQELGKHQEELAERQKQLRELGLVDAAEDDKNPVAWVRKRLKNLFSL